MQPQYISRFFRLIHRRWSRLQSLQSAVDFSSTLPFVRTDYDLKGRPIFMTLCPCSLTDSHQAAEEVSLAPGAKAPGIRMSSFYRLMISSLSSTQLLWFFFSFSPLSSSCTYCGECQQAEPFYFMMCYPHGLSTIRVEGKHRGQQDSTHPRKVVEHF